MVALGDFDGIRPARQSLSALELFVCRANIDRYEARIADPAFFGVRDVVSRLLAAERRRLTI